MASAETQTNRPMAVKTPLGADALLLTSFSGHEGLSQLFSYHLDVLCKNTQEVAFDKLLGNSITVRVDLAGSNGPALSTAFAAGSARARATTISATTDWKSSRACGC